MNRIKSILFVISILFSVISLAACTEILPYNGYFDGGEILDNELMSEIRSKYVVEETTENNNEVSSSSSLESKSDLASDISETDDNKETEHVVSISSETASATEITEESETSNTSDTNESTETNPDIAFWTENGEVYHTKEACRYLKNKSYTTGTIQQAIENGKERLCSTCGK